VRPVLREVEGKRRGEESVLDKRGGTGDGDGEGGVVVYSVGEVKCCGAVH